MADIRLENVTKSYNKKNTVIENLNLTIEEYGLCTEGEILTLYNIHRIVNGLAKEKHDTTIDDIIPF